MPVSKPASQKDSENAADSLLRFWETGESSWSRLQSGGYDAAPRRDRRNGGKRKNGYAHPNKTRILRAAAGEAGFDPATLAKAWKAAREYTRGQIEELCRRVRGSKSRFGPTHLCRVMAVGDRRMRDSLTLAAIRGRWGVTTLERKIRAAQGRRDADAGQRPAVPAGEPELLLVLDALCGKWIRWCEAAGDAVPEGLRESVRRAMKAVARVRKDAAEIRDRPVAGE